jgi:hypothetical protein
VAVDTGEEDGDLREERVLEVVLSVPVKKSEVEGIN